MAITGAFIFACTGCGGGDGGGNQQQPAVSAPTPKPMPKAVLVETYGDSTALGALLAPQSFDRSQAPSAFLQNALRTRLGDRITVSNQAVSGTESANLLNGDGQHKPWAQQVNESGAQVVVFSFGVGDAGQEHVSPGEYAANMMKLVSIAKAAGKIAVVETPTPTNVDPWLGDRLRDQYVPALRAAAASNNVPLVEEYVYVTSLANWQAMLPDGIHPNAVLQEIKGSRQADVIMGLITAL